MLCTFIHSKNPFFLNLRNNDLGTHNNLILQVIVLRLSTDEISLILMQFKILPHVYSKKILAF